MNLVTQKEITEKYNVRQSTLSKILMEAGVGPVGMRENTQGITVRVYDERQVAQALWAHMKHLAEEHASIASELRARMNGIVKAYKGREKQNGNQTND